MPNLVAVDLPPELKRFLEERTGREGFADPRDYICHLIERERRRLEHEHHEAASDSAARQVSPAA